jgi:zinc protease
LPARAAEIPSYAAQRQARFRADLAPVTLTHKGQEDQALVLAGWPTTDDDDYQRTVGLIMLADLLDLELTEKLREELGASYGVNVSSLNSSVFDQFGYVTASVVVDPKRIDEVEKAIGEVVARLRDQPVSADLLARARNPNLERIDRQERDNAYWLVRVGEAQSDAERLDRHRLRKAAYLAVTPEQVRALARQYLAADRRLTLRVVSDKAQLAAR